MANLFNSVVIRNPKRKSFNLSHFSKLSTEFGRLTPIMCEPVLPADKFRVSTTLKVRFAPMTFPVMERFKAFVHYWFVPNRLIWDNWEEFITGGETGVEDLAHPYPVITIDSNLGDSKILESNFAPGSLFDYLGFPAKTLTSAEKSNLARNNFEFDALPFKAYQLIYDEWYRDQNLETKMDLRTDVDGNQNDNDDATDNGFVNALMSLRYRAWRKDYFTSALPDPQRGPDVTLPMFGELDIVGSNMPVSVDKAENITDGVGESAIHSHSSGGSLQFAQLSENEFDNDDAVKFSGVIPKSTLESKLAVDRDNLRMASINDLRKGFAVQRLYELAARVGGRYAENIFGNFGVHAGDARLQRPEYLGGSVVPVFVGDVLQTSESSENGTPLGMPAGVAGALDKTKAFTRHFTEHGWIIGILSIVPEATYLQGIPRKFLKRDRLDFAWPLLANLGEQEIQNQELYFEFGGSDANNKGTFGYTPRYAEYRFGVSGAHGDFRSTLRDFHDARIFDSRPALNSEFIKIKPTGNSTGLNRIFAVTGEQYDHLWVDLYNDVFVKRKLPKYGTPI